MGDTFSYSMNEENYWGSFGSPEEAAANILDEDGDCTRCWVGRNVPPPAPEDSWDAEDWIERVSTQDSYSGDWADDWFRATREQVTELESEVRDVMAKWLDRHGLRPKFFNVEDSQEWELVDGKPMPRKVRGAADAQSD